MYDDVTCVYDDVTYVYDDVTYVYDDLQMQTQSLRWAVIRRQNSLPR